MRISTQSARGAVTRTLLLTLALPLLFFSTGLGAQTIFSDDFERAELGDFWNADWGWTILNGQAYSGFDDDWSLLTTAQSFDATTYAIETEVTGFVAGYQRAYYLLFGQQDDTGDVGYVVRYDPLGGGLLTLGITTDNYLYPDELDRDIIDLDGETAYRIRVVRYENGLMQVYVGDADGFPDLPNLEAIDTTYPTLGKVSWTTFTQGVYKEFFIQYIRADVPAQQKDTPEKVDDDELVEKIVASSDNDYVLSRLTEGVTMYTDRDYTITQIPTFLEDARFIQTPNNDKKRTSPNLFSVYLSSQAIAYVAFDPRATTLPAWLSSWTKIDETIGTTDPGSDYMELYTKVVPSGLFGPSRYQLDLGSPLSSPAVGTNMNFLVVLVPSGPDFRYEAEVADLSGVRTASNHPGFTGTGFADYINPTNDYIEWTIDVPATSPYALRVRFAHGGTSPRDLRVTVDGQDVADLAFNPTRSWSSWALRSLGNSILLSAGQHRIRLTAIGSSGPNVDYLQFSPASNYTAPTSTPFVGTSLPPQALAQTGDPAPVTVNVYPNPVINTLTFRLEGQFHSADLRVLDAGGREVYRRPVSSPFGEATTELHRLGVGHWPAGTYLYRVSSGDQVVMGKFVKVE